jgi:hypothetical protein
MKIIETLGAQGEIRAFRIDRIPEDAVPVEPENGRYIIGHSETGHHHVLEAERVALFEAKNAPAGMRILYALLDSPGELKHLRPYDTHAPHSFAPGAYMFRTDREFDHYAELARRVAD